MAGLSPAGARGASWTVAGVQLLVMVDHLMVLPLGPDLARGVGLPVDRLGLLEISWYTGQLRRIGRGEAPRPNESGLWVFARQAWQMAMAGKNLGLPSRLRAT